MRSEHSRSRRAPRLDYNAFAALIGLNWADQKHDLCLLVPGQPAPERLTLANTAETITEWIGKLRQRFGGRRWRAPWKKPAAASSTR